MLARRLADHYDLDAGEVRKVVYALVRGGALLRYEGGSKKRQRLWIGTGRAEDIVWPRLHPERPQSRARERASASDLPASVRDIQRSKGEGKVLRVSRW